MPNPKLPVSEKLRFLNSYSFTFRPRSRISSAFGPRTVTCTAIFSFLRIPKVRTVYRALPVFMFQLSHTQTRVGRELRTIYRCLTTKLFQDLCSSCKPITGFSDWYVQNQLLNSEFSHGVRSLITPIWCLNTSNHQQAIELLIISQIFHLPCWQRFRIIFFFGEETNLFHVLKSIRSMRHKWVQ